ncbi:hypothetical protein ACFY3M_13995 [Streptomyces mirabilis]|uniref:hypothetical protein n=1 Tax=Streptomyces mirabilis TaxID=68239 RepID=UPI0036A527F1
MSTNVSPEQAAAAALVKLLAARPELRSVVWTVGETPGVLRGHQIAETGSGEIVDACAELMGGTVARSVLSRDSDRQGVAQLVAEYAGVSVDVWASYPLPDSHGLTSTDLHQILVGRAIGTLALLPGDAQ